MPHADPSLLQMLLGLLGFLLPLVLYAVWSTLAFWDLGRRDGVGTAAVWGWALAIFVLPILGALAYLLFGGSRLPRQLTLAAVGGGALIYVAVLALGTAVGGIA
jgi:hypothetical protein